jgi:hypothetical protein
VITLDEILAGNAIAGYAYRVGRLDGIVEVEGVRRPSTAFASVGFGHDEADGVVEKITAARQRWGISTRVGVDNHTCFVVQTESGDTIAIKFSDWRMSVGKNVVVA